MKVLNWIKKNLAVLIPVMLILGLLNGHWNPMEYSRVICVSALLIMIFPVFINLEFNKGLKEFSNSKWIIVSTSLVNFVLYPLIAYGIGWIFLRNEPAMWLGLVLLSLIPTSGMTINWTYFTKGNMASIMAIVSAGIILSVIVLPFGIPYINAHLMGDGTVNVDKQVILEKLFFIIVIPVIFGYVARKIIIKIKGYEFFQKMKPVNGGISALGVIIVSFLVMSLKINQSILNEPEILLKALIPVTLFYILIFSISHFLGNFLYGKENAKAFFFGTAARYHVITLGVALGTYQEYDFLGLITIMIALGLAIQIPALAFYAKYLQKKDADLEQTAQA
jgi:ACR3 family arsenite efflux pump ArsB